MTAACALACLLQPPPTCTPTFVMRREMEGVIEAHHEPKPGAEPLGMAEMHVARPGVQFAELLRRNFTIYWRAPEYNVRRCLPASLPAYLHRPCAHTVDSRPCPMRARPCAFR